MTQAAATFILKVQEKGWDPLNWKPATEAGSRERCREGLGRCSSSGNGSISGTVPDSGASGNSDDSGLVEGSAAVSHLSCCEAEAEAAGAAMSELGWPGKASSPLMRCLDVTVAPAGSRLGTAFMACSAAIRHQQVNMHIVSMPLVGAKFLVQRRLSRMLCGH